MVSSEVSSDQMNDGCKDYISKWLWHTFFSVPLINSLFHQSMTLFKARVLITFLKSNLFE
jgi:hypothetical protein